MTTQKFVVASLLSLALLTVLTGCDKEETAAPTATPTPAPTAPK